MVYHISYDLKKPGKDYTDLYSEIKKLGSWCHPVDSTWYVDTTANATSIRDALLSVMDSTDALVVTAAGTPGAWSGLESEVSEWLKNHLS